MTSLRDLLAQMSGRGASDLLISAGAPPNLRVHGSLLAVDGEGSISAADAHALAASVLNPAQAAMLESTRNVDFSKGFEGLGRFRFNIFYQRDCLSLAVRIIPFDIPSRETLGLPPIVDELAALPSGLVLITGPAGSGKSTTLAAVIDMINRTRRVHIICLEDPIEYLHRHQLGIIDQREVLGDVPSFGVALRSVFRQSPDVIMVGEMRDLETVSLALTLAETGHLIFATLHTRDTTHAISRIVDAFPADQQPQIYAQLSLVLEAVVAQQLIPSRDGTRSVLACEVLRATNAVRNLIRERQSQQIYTVIQTGRADGMVTMNESLRRLCRAGLIDEGAAMHRSPRPKDLARILAMPGDGGRDLP